MTALAKGQTNIACEPLLTNRRVEFFTERLAVRPPAPSRRPEQARRFSDRRAKRGAARANSPKTQKTRLAVKS